MAIDVTNTWHIQRAMVAGLMIHSSVISTIFEMRRAHTATFRMLRTQVRDARQGYKKYNHPCAKQIDRRQVSAQIKQYPLGKNETKHDLHMTDKLQRAETARKTPVARKKKKANVCSTMKGEGHTCAQCEESFTKEFPTRLQCI